MRLTTGELTVQINWMGRERKGEKMMQKIRWPAKKTHTHSHTHTLIKHMHTDENTKQLMLLHRMYSHSWRSSSCAS